MNEERIAQLVVEYLLAEASGMVDSEKESTKAKASDEGNGGGSGKSGKSASFKSIEDIFKQFETKLFALLAPAALVASVLSSAASGMSVFIGAIKIVGNTLGMLLAPGVMLLSALLLTVADVIQDALLPNLEDWYTFIITNGIAAIEFLEKSIITGANAVLDFAHMVALAIADINQALAVAMILKAVFQKMIGDEEGAQKSMGSALDFMKKSAELRQSKQTQMQAGDILKQLGISVDENGNPIPMQAGGFTDRLKGNLSKVNQQFRMDNMPKASQTSLSGAYFAAQMATLQMTPFERENLKLTAKVADTMDKVLAKITPTTN